MTNKLYYDDPLKATYMAREFGVKYWETIHYPSEDNNYYPFFTYDTGEYPDVKEVIYSDYDRFYVHPDSYHIFEDNEDWDIALLQDAEEFFFPFTYYGEKGWHFSSTSPIGNYTQSILDEKGINTIIRDNKHFFMPEVE